MIVRTCSGGIVFNGDSVLLLSNEKHDWFFPKGVVRAGQKDREIALQRVKIEAGIDAAIVAPCGKTHYEFYSITRQKPVHNNITWYVMKATSTDIVPNPDEDVIEGKFVNIEEAMETVTYSQDKTLLMMAYQRYKELT